MQNPPPPSQQQAADAQQARYAAETAILELFQATETSGEGSEEGDDSSLHAVRIAIILAVLSAAITYSSFRHPDDRTKSLLLDKVDHDGVAEGALFAAQSAFNALLGSELTDEQRAVLWATWAYSETAQRIAEAVDSGLISHEFADRGLGLKKVWISRSDGRVRPLHAKLHGKTVSTSKDFWRWPLTGQRLRWPGDRDAPADAVIGCRCVCLLSWAKQGEVSETIRKIVDRTKKS